MLIFRICLSWMLIFYKSCNYVEKYDKLCAFYKIL